MRMLLLAALSLQLAACSSSGTPGGRFLYRTEGVETPVLLDSEIRVESFRSLAPGAKPDIRLLRCRKGVITASVDGRFKAGEGPVPFDEYAALWGELERAQAGNFESEAPDRSGGYYHVVRLVMGTRIENFTAQDKVTVLGFSTSEIQQRLDLVNEIVELIGRHADARPRSETPADESR